MTTPALPSPVMSDRDYSFLEALTIGASTDQLSDIPRGRPYLPSTPLAATSVTVKPLSSPGQANTFFVEKSELRSPPRTQTLRKPAQMGSQYTSKSQAQCLDICSKTTKLGDRVSVRMLEYLSSVKQTSLPHGLDDLAHGFLSTCETLLTLEAGLVDCGRTGQVFPIDLLTELEKKFRVCQSDFNLLDQMLGKTLEAERKHGTMGKMKRGLSKLFGEVDFEKMTHALEQTRESLRMSALMFQWTLGNEKIESGMGIGYTGLAAALNRLDRRAGKVKTTASVSGSNGSNGSNSSQYNLPPSRQPEMPPLPPLPQWAERSTSMNQDSVTHVHSPTSQGRPWPVTATSTSSVGSNERVANPGTFDMLTSFEETFSHHTGSESAHDGLIEEIAHLDLGTSKGAVRLNVDAASMPRWAPRGTVGPEAQNYKSALTAAIRGRNHKLVEQLLDRGCPPNAGPEMLALNEAVHAQDVESIRLLLLFGADPNERDREGTTPLGIAVEKNFLNGAVILLKYGADASLQSGLEEESPLAIAGRNSKANFTHLLLMYGADVTQISTSGNTMLISAITKKTSVKTIDLILEYGADPNAKSKEGKTALFEAISCARADIVTSLLRHKANPNLPGPKHMLWPAVSQAPCLQVLLAHGADYKKTPGIMELASSINNVESVRILLNAGVDPNAKKDGVYTPLCTSIRDDHADIFRLLLSNGADPNIPASEYPAFKCITHGRLQYLPELLAAGANLRSPKGIMETAVSSNSMEAVLWLLDQGIDINERSPKGHSPLSTAIREKNVEMVDLLIMRGADPNKRGEDWPVCMAVHTPQILKRVLSVLSEPRAFKGVIERAVAAGQLESVKLLLGAGISVEDKNGGVFSPLTTAIRENKRDIVTYLLDPNGGNADVNAPGEHLPIVKAVRRFHGENSAIIAELLDHGADPNKIYRGWNAMFQAVENGDIQVLQLLRDKGGGVDMTVRDDMGHTVLEMAEQRGWDEAIDLLRGDREAR